MFRVIASIILALSAIAGVILNFVAALASGKNFFELATLNDLGVVFLVWGQYPVAALIIVVLVVASGTALLVTKK